MSGFDVSGQRSAFWFSPTLTPSARSWFVHREQFLTFTKKKKRLMFDFMWTFFRHSQSCLMTFSKMLYIIRKVINHSLCTSAPATFGLVWGLASFFDIVFFYCAVNVRVVCFIRGRPRTEPPFWILTPIQLLTLPISSVTETLSEDLRYGIDHKEKL